MAMARDKGHAKVGQQPAQTGYNHYTQGSKSSVSRANPPSSESSTIFASPRPLSVSLKTVTDSLRPPEGSAQGPRLETRVADSCCMWHGVSPNPNPKTRQKSNSANYNDERTNERTKTALLTSLWGCFFFLIPDLVIDDDRREGPVSRMSK